MATLTSEPPALSTEATVTIVAACIPVLHPLYDRARAGLRKIFPGLRRRQQADQGTITTADGHPDARGAADSPGFWSLKLRAITVAESWWSSTGGRTSRRSGVRGGGVQTEEDHNTRRLSSGTAVSAAVVVHSEGAEWQGGEVKNSRGMSVSDRVTELSVLERGPDLSGGHAPGISSSGHTTVVGQK